MSPVLHTAFVLLPFPIVFERKPTKYTLRFGSASGPPLGHLLSSAAYNVDCDKITQPKGTSAGDKWSEMEKIKDTRRHWQQKTTDDVQFGVQFHVRPCHS